MCWCSMFWMSYRNEICCICEMDGCQHRWLATINHYSLGMYHPCRTSNLSGGVRLYCASCCLYFCCWNDCQCTTAADVVDNACSAQLMISGFVSPETPNAVRSTTHFPFLVQYSVSILVAVTSPSVVDCSSALVQTRPRQQMPLKNVVGRSGVEFSIVAMASRQPLLSIWIPKRSNLWFCSDAHKNLQRC